MSKNTNVTKAIKGEIVAADAVNVSEYATKIGALIERATRAWLDTADLLAEAKRKLSKEKFDHLLELIPLSKSSVLKLIKIGNCQWITERRDQLSRIDSWGTLHEVTLLDSKGRNKLAKQYLSADEPKHFRRSDVAVLRNNSSGKSGDPARLVAKITSNPEIVLSERDMGAVGSAFSMLDNISSINAKLTKDGADLLGLVSKNATEQGGDNNSSQSHGF